MAHPVSNHVRDAVYRTVANPGLTPAQKAAAINAIAEVNRQAQQIHDMQTMGPMGGAADLHLRPEIAPVVAAGAPRPFAPGEYVQNPDGSWSSERSMTVQAPGFNQGKATNIPSVWIKDGKPYEAKDEREAMQLAKQSGLGWKSFPDIKTADQASIDRENDWQTLERPEDADRIAPLYEAAAAPPVTAEPELGAQIDDQRKRALAALATPTTYPVVR